MKRHTKIILISACIMCFIGTSCTTQNNHTGKRESAETTIERIITETTSETISEDIWETEITELISTTSATTTKSVTESVTESITESITEAETIISESKTEKAAQMYVLNTNTMKIHYPTCSSVEDISPDNYSETYDYSEAISQGYKPCKRCYPEE